MNRVIKKLKSFYSEYIGKRNLIMIGVLLFIIIINVALTIYLQTKWGG